MQIIKIFERIYFISAIFSFVSFTLLNCGSNKPVFIIQLVDSKKQAGHHKTLWNQLDDNGKLVSENRYNAKLSLNSQELNSEFYISSTASHVPVLPDSSQSGIGTLPIKNSISTNASIYAFGDTVCIYFQIKKAQQVSLTIEKFK